MQKWIYLIGLLIAGPFLAYKLFVSPPPKNSPNFVAHAYVKAAIDSDLPAIRRICEGESVATDAERLAPIVRTHRPWLWAFRFKAMRPLHPRSDAGLQTMMGGKVLRMEFVGRKEGWKVVSLNWS